MKRTLSLLLTLVLLLGVLTSAVLADTLLTNAAALDIGSETAWDAGYSGQGMVIAVIDTGINLDHEAFQVYDGVLGTTALTKTQAQQTISRLGRGVWVSDKIPYAWDYTNNSDNAEDGVGHGTHVAGSAAGYVPEEDGNTGFTGSAPGAQLLIMKVFDDDGTSAGPETVLQAIEDAMTLGADVVNLSMGAVNGFSQDPDFQDVFTRLREAGILVCCAAGNEGNEAYDGDQYLVSADYQDYGVVSSPASLPDTISIASMNPSTVLGYGLIVGDTVCTYTDIAASDSLLTLYGDETLTYVMIPGLGAAADYENAAVAKTIAGLNQAGTPWAAVVRRGELYFTEKVENAAAAGAAALVCYNDEEGTFAMSIDDYLIPAVSVTAQAGEALQAAADSQGMGKLTVSRELHEAENPTGGLVSDYSSWGTTSDLLFVPQLTAVGDEVWAPWSGSSRSYASESGTSMASGSAAGAMACALQFVRAGTGKDKTPAQQADLAQAMVQSTAKLLVNWNGVPYSPRQQGAGAIDLEALLNASVYLENPVQALGDDPACTGTLELAFTLHNPGTAQSCTLTGQLLTELVADGLDQMESRSLDGLYTLTAVLNGKTVSPAGFTLPAGESTLEITIQLTAEGLAAMEADFPNGGYLEGFVTLTPKTGSAVHGSFLSFWGDWTQGSILSAYDFADVLEAQHFLETTPYSEDGETPFLFEGVLGIPVVDAEGNYVSSPNGFTLTWAELGYTVNDYLDMLDGDGVLLVGDLNWAYVSPDPEDCTDAALLGENSMGAVGYEEDRNALCAGEALVLYPSQLRNARRVIMLVSDAETGQLYSVDDLEYQPKLYFDGEEWARESYFYWFQTDDNPASDTWKEDLPDGTTVTVSFYAWEDYNTAAEKAYEALRGKGYEKYRSMLTNSVWQQVLEWSFSVTLDQTAPSMVTYDFDSATKQLTLTVTDNEYLAYVEVRRKPERTGMVGYNAFYTEVLSETEAGAVSTITLDLDDYFLPSTLPQTLYLTLEDYAGNTTDVTIKTPCA